MRLVIDLSSVVWTALYAGKDTENGREVEFNGKKVLVNSAAFGRENALNMIVGAWKRFDIAPMNTISVFEGKSTKALRIKHLSCYKGGAEAPVERAPEAYEEFNKLKLWLIEDLRALGAHAVTQDGVEGDDIIAYLCKNLEGEIRVLTGDGDITVLTNERVKIWRRGEICENPYGPFQPKYITLYKALVGDPSDKIPGAKGFGEKAWLDVLCLFGDEGLEMLDALVREKRIPELAEDVPELKSLQKIIDSEPLVYQSYAAASMYPELVNTLRRPLVWTTGYTGNPKIADERLKPYEALRGVLVNAGNYHEVMRILRAALSQSPFVALDIETSTPDESDQWLMRLKGLDADDDLGVDVFGSELAGLSLTFGPNMQFSVYLAVDHADQTRNLSVAQVLDAVRLIPKTTEIVVHNAGFELPVLYNTWGAHEKDNGYHGFLPNVVDTSIMASFVDENERRGLKALSKRLFGYDQVSYDEVTKGRKMCDIPAEEVVAYGCDDTIMTAGLYNFFSIVMELEKTMHAYRTVEIKPAYVLALSYVQGCRFNMARMKEIEKEDQDAFEEAWGKVRDFLISTGAEGTVCPTFTVDDLKVPAKIKEIFALVMGWELKTQIRTPEKLFKLIAGLSGGIKIDDSVVECHETLAALMQDGNIEAVNAWAKRNFNGEPVMDFDSPKIMRKLLYETFNLPVRLVNKATATEREKKPVLASAVSKFNRIRAGKSETLTAEEAEIIKVKAKTDSKAIGFALLYQDGTPEVRALLGWIQTIKTAETRRKLFYEKYRNVRHWKDDLIHSNMNQVGTVTRRPSSSGPNLNQLPKKGEGVKFRECFVPHCEDGVIVSIDFAGQELRLSADLSRDQNLLDCFVGANTKDVHSLTASGAMRRKWGDDFVGQCFPTFGIDADAENADYDLFLKLRSKGSPYYKKADDLRKGSKNVNFATHYEAQPAKVSETLIIPIEDAVVFSAAKDAMFPRFVEWRDQDVKSRVRNTGYAVTYLGARRHLAAKLTAEDKWEAEGALRQAPNFEIQGSAAEQTKLAMAALWDSGALIDYDARFIANIYDELVASVSIKDAVPFIKVLHECMSQKYMEVVDSVGSISLGPDFGTQIEAGEVFDEGAINASLDEVRGMRGMRLAA